MPEEIDILGVIRLIKKKSNYDFSDYSEKSFRRRIEKVLSDNRIEIPELLDRLSNDPDFLEHTVTDITVNTTELFRDVETWHAIRYRVLSKLKRNESIRIWHAGCSTGQEPYSMAMLLHELGIYDKTQILATDLNTNVLAVAHEAKYQFRFNREYLDNFDKVLRYNPYNYEETYNVPADKYFEIDTIADSLTMRDMLKTNITFMKHDLVTLEPPVDTEFDIIICRNVLIYFNYQLQNRVIDLFYNSLSSKGFLILGKHESLLGPKANKFVKRGNYYSKKNIV